MNILILDQSLTQQTVISSFESFDFDAQLNKKGSFQLTVNADSRQARLIETGQILYVTPEECGYINKVEEIAEHNDASNRIVISGTELKDVIGCRVTSPSSGVASYQYTQQTTEYIVRDLLDKHLINPSYLNKQVSIFRLGSTNNVGTAKDFSTRFKQLDAQVFELLLEDQLGLKAHVDVAAKLVYFTVYAGLDRTVGQSTNSRAVFSLKTGTLSRANTLWDEATYRNVGYVGGKGEGIDREVIEITSNNAISGLNRWETFIDARDAETTEELTTRGNVKLSEHNRVFSVDGTASITGKLTYDLGDWVTIEDNRGNRSDVQITGIKTTRRGTGIPTRALTFGDASMDIAQAINARLSGISNLLTQ